MKKLWWIALTGVLFCSCAMLGKIVGNMLTQSTADLTNCSIVAAYTTNLYPASTKTTEVAYVPAWAEGNNIISLNVLKRQGIGMYKIDGTVKISDSNVAHIANGAYGLMTPGTDRDPKKIVIQTTTGKTAEFSIKPTYPVTITKINGKSELAEVDLNQDMVIELDNPKGSENTMVSVKLLMDVLGTRSFVETVVARSAGRIVVPKEAFSQALVSASASGFVSFNKGANTVLVERFVIDLEQIEGLGAIEKISKAWSSMPVTVSGDAGNKNGITLEGTYGEGTNQFSFSASKPPAFYGIPFSKGKNFGLASFTIRGTIFHQTVKSSSSTTGNVTTTTVTTTTLEFPQLPDSYWDNLLETVYADFMKTLKSEYKINLVPIEKVTQAAAYAGLEAPVETNTSVKVARNYKGTKNLIPTTLSGIMASVSSTFAHDRPTARLMREAGVDGLISVTIDFQIAQDDQGHVVLNPIMSYKFDGPVNGYSANTVYGWGRVQGQGAPFSKAAVEGDPKMLNQVLQKDMLMGAFKKMLHDLQALEDKEGYARIWALQ